GLGRVDVGGQLAHRRPLGLHGLDVWEGRGRGDHCLSILANMRSPVKLFFPLRFLQRSLQTCSRPGLLVHCGASRAGGTARRGTALRLLAVQTFQLVNGWAPRGSDGEARKTRASNSLKLLGVSV